MKITYEIYLQLVYYVGLAITSYFAISVVGTDWEKHDSTDHVAVFNCTCLSETEFQCYQESVRTGRSTFDINCDKIEEPTKYEVCYCGQWVKNRCSFRRCYVIQAYDVPESCDYQKCSALDGLRMWMLAAKAGVFVGVAAVVLLIISMYLVAKRSKNIGISTLFIVHLAALVPPIMVAFSMLTTNVLQRKYYVGLNAWAWTMVIVFGFGFCIGWIYYCRSTIAKAAKYYRKKCQNANEMNL